MSSSMSSITTNTTGATKLRKNSVANVKAKALWKTAVSVIANNFGFLVLVLFFAHTVRHIATFEKLLEVHVGRKLGSEVSGLRSELGKLLDNESLEGVLNSNEMGLDEIPGFAKKVLNGNEWLTGYEVGKFETKMEVQVDRKLESEASGLRSELGKRMDDESGKMDDESGKLRKWMDDESEKFNKRFSEMDARIGSLEGVLNGNKWLTREEFDKFVEELHVDRMLSNEIANNPRNLQEILNRHTFVASKEVDALTRK